MSDEHGPPPPFVSGASMPGASAEGSGEPERVRLSLDPRLPVMGEGRNGGSLYRGGLPAELRPDSAKGKTLGDKTSRAIRFNRKMRKLAESPATARALRSVLCDPDHDQFMRALEFVTERAFGRVPQAVKAEHTHQHTHAVVLLPAMDAPPVQTVEPSPVPLPLLSLPETADPTASKGTDGATEATDGER